MLGEIESPTSARGRGLTTSSMMRRAITTGSCSATRSSQTTTNSSPPKRATVSPGRSRRERRRATERSSASPTWPERVVDRLELVEIEEEHADPALGPPRPRQRVLQALDQQGAVGKAGQRIVQRLVGERLLGALALDGVAEARTNVVPRVSLLSR